MIKILSDELVYRGRFIRVVKRNFLDRNNQPGVWEVVKRKIHGRIVSIAAITPEKEIILEKIFRLPFKDYILELPAGLTDVRGEAEIESAKRELLEETGYLADSLELLTAGSFNAGLTEDELAMYLGQNARLVAKPKLEGPEDITVIKVPVSELMDYLQNQKGIKVDIKIFSFFPFLQKRGLL